MKRKLFSGRLEYDHLRDRWFLQNYDGEVVWLNNGDSVDIGSVYNCSLKAVLSRIGTTWMWNLPVIPSPRVGLSASLWLPDDAVA